MLGLEPIQRSSTYQDENKDSVNLRHRKQVVSSCTKGYEIRGRKKSAREIVATVRQRIRESNGEFFLSSNDKFKNIIRAQAKLQSTQKRIPK